MFNSCSDCRHFEADYEESDGHIVGSWCCCLARHGVSNLKQFPFKRTECEKFELKRSLKLVETPNDQE